MNGNSERGGQKITVAAMEMRGLSAIESDCVADQPFAGIAMLVCVTPTPETGVFLLALQKLGARIAACSDNAFATDDDVVAYLRAQGVTVFAQSNMSPEQYQVAMKQAVNAIADAERLHIIDDGCDITRYIAENHPQLFRRTRLISEQTTCGVHYLKRLYRQRQVDAPAVNINHCYSKQLLDNHIGIQQSLIHALTVAGVSLPGKRVTVFGFGPLGQGVAQAMRASGAHVAVVESDIIALMQAEMMGYMVYSAEEALGRSDLCLTATGCIDTISADMLADHAGSELMLGNLGHGTQEFAVSFLEQTGSKTRLNQHIDAYELADGRVIYSLCKGALVNFLAGGGNMPKVMGMTFSLTLLAHLQAARSAERLPVALHRLDRSLELQSAQYNFSHLADKLLTLSDDQKRYLTQA